MLSPRGLLTQCEDVRVGPDQQRAGGCMWAGAAGSALFRARLEGRETQGPLLQGVTWRPTRSAGLRSGWRKSPCHGYCWACTMPATALWQLPSVAWRRRSLYLDQRELRKVRELRLQTPHPSDCP